MTGTTDTYERLRDYIDVDVRQVTEGEEELKPAGKRVFDELLEVGSGKRINAAVIGYTYPMNIYVTCPML